MLMKCGSCGHDNQLGAIFCRGCGEKLDVETMRPKVMENKGSASGIGGLIRNLIGFLIFLGLAGVIVMMFYPQDLSVYPSLTGDDALKAAKIKYDAMLKKADTGFGDDSYSFTPQEATYLYNELFVAKAPTDSSAYNIEKLIFSTDSVGFTHIILKTKLGGKLPTTFEITGTIVNSDKVKDSISVRFNAMEYKMGHMPIKFAEKQVLEKYDPALAGANIDKILKALTKIEYNTDTKSFVLKF
ncbi:MAG TPA: hypothetical protein DET40_19365 [Lentisphaeria bacterium]|nr:MAG: hypothetical protein A2X45_18195 [Lentisphaerae bacterium GWF2_50_93]HCE45707.1 hypothetical protein [Lentisphaeria bacterium]